MARLTAALAASLVAAALLLCTAPAHAAPIPEEARFALVIGNSAYPGVPPLGSCAASANVVTAALKRAGFSVTEQLDRTTGQMDGDITALTRAVGSKPASSAVIYICGYAAGFNDRTFLLPVSATIDRASDVLTQGLAAKSVPDAIRGSNAAAGLVLLDAVAWPTASSKLALDTLMNAPPVGKVGVAAASSANVPPEGATALAAAFAASLTGPDVEVGAVLTALRQNMPSAPGTELTIRPPAEAAWLAGGPVPPSAPAAAPAPQPPTQAVPAAPAPQAQPPAFPDEADMTPADRETIQRALLHLGYYDGPVDGVFGPDTRAAIRRFQHEISADMTGRITPEQAGRLLSEAH